MGERVRIGKRVVEGMRPGSVIWDAEVAGFGARRQREAVAYVLKTRARSGRQLFLTIGRHGSPWTPDTARAEARRLLHVVAEGRDPAAERATEQDLDLISAAIERERRARTAIAAHDASREFHLLVAAATHNRELVASIEAQWLIEVGRRLLARRRAAPAWQERDVAEHVEILAALHERDGDRAARLMEEHVRDALRHWGAA